MDEYSAGYGTGHIAEYGVGYRNAYSAACSSEYGTGHSGGHGVGYGSRDSATIRGGGEPAACPTP